MVSLSLRERAGVRSWVNEEAPTLRNPLTLTLPPIEYTGTPEGEGTMPLIFHRSTIPAILPRLMADVGNSRAGEAGSE